MTLFSMAPMTLDMPGHIADLLSPLKGRGFTCDETEAFNVWRLLEIYEHQKFNMPDLAREHHVGGVGEVYERKKEAAELTLRAFKAVFGRAAFSRVKERILGPTLCRAHGTDGRYEISPAEFERGKKFFKVWRAEARKLRIRRRKMV